MNILHTGSAPSGQSPPMQMSTTLDASAPPLPADFAELYAESYDFMWRCALRLGADPATVEDIVQDSFIVALRRFDDFEVDAGVRPTTWLFGILRNVIRNHARAERRRQTRLERYRQMPLREPRVRAEAGLAAHLIDEFLATLDADKRAVFVLGEIEGMTGPEIAQALGLNLNTSNSRLRAARKAFARHFVDDAPPRRALARVANIHAPARARRHSIAVVASAAGYSVGGAALTSVLAGLSSKLLAALIFASACLGAVVIVVSPGASTRTTEASREPSQARDRGPRAFAGVDAPVAAVPVEALEIHAEDKDEEPSEASATAPRNARPPANTRESAAYKRELDRLEQARAALMDSDAALALQLVEGGPFDDGLERRRASLEISALCRLDRGTEAERRARAWRAGHAHDPQVSTFVAVCWTE